MSLRTIQESDLPRLTEIARRGLEFESLDEALIHEKVFGGPDRDPELGLLFTDDDRITSFAQGVIGGQLDGKTKGCIRFFCTDRAYRREGHADALFDELETRLKQRGAEVITIMDSPANYLTPGVDFRYTDTYCFLLARGYTVFRENHNMRCHLHVDKWPDLDDQVQKLAKDGIEVRRARPDDWESIKTFLEIEWKGWVPEVKSAMENDPCTVYIAVIGNETVAFGGYQGNNKSLPFYGPMGTSEKLRGRGAGAVIMRLGLRDLARQGWNYGIIPWVGPVPFYVRFANAWLDRCFWAYRKDV